MKRVWWKPLLILSSLALMSPLLEVLLGQSPEVATSSLDVFKIKRYLSVGMYREAITELEPAIKADEFNPGFKILYGIALRNVKRFDDYIYNLTAAMNLDTAIGFQLKNC